ncbi:MAG: arsenite methyltransferase [Pirellulales bacterium]|nr:arsenite methyltransferase [Planctomycetales bacterium]
MNDSNDQTSVAQSERMRDTVREGYAQVATNNTSLPLVEAGGGCCGGSPCTPDDVARAVGYSADELATLPAGANMGLSCGNPAVVAALSPGEVVLDLGAGGGFDVFLCGPKVGATGRVIGVDMTHEMLAKARGNVAAYRQRSGLDNVEFRLGEIEHLPVADNSVDVVISNCVINLSPDKPQVWREIARVLKPGGRVAVSDMALLQPLPPVVTEMVEAIVGCVAGAVLVEETERMARQAGLVDIVATSKREYLKAMTSSHDPLYKSVREALPDGDLSDYVTSLDMSAVKPPS